MSGIISRMRAELIGKIPPREYIVARQAMLEGMKVRGERMLAVSRFELLSAEPERENIATDAIFFSKRESVILEFAAQALQANSIRIDHGGEAEMTETLTISPINRKSVP